MDDNTLLRQKKVVERYYNYYVGDGVDKKLLDPIKNSGKSGSIFCLTKYFKSLPIDKETGLSGNDKSRIFDKLMIRIQDACISGNIFIPLPHGLGEFSVGMSQSSGLFMRRKIKRKENGPEDVSTINYATKTGGKFFRLVWIHSKSLHSHIRFYRFKPVVGKVLLDPNTGESLYYGTDGLLAKIYETNTNPNIRDYKSNFII
jgi:hypothetical protein